MTSIRFRVTRSVLTAFALFVVLSPQPAPAQGAPQSAQTMNFFITSVGMGNGGDLGGLFGAEKHCQTLAAAVGAGNGSWRADLSAHSESSGKATAGTDAVGRAAA